MQLSLNEGERWGQLHCIRVWNDIETKRNEFGLEETVVTPKAKIRCNCGREFEIRIALFPGKRRLKDCGCGLSIRAAARTVLTAYLPVTTLHRLRAYAGKRGVSISQATNELLISALSGSSDGT